LREDFGRGGEITFAAVGRSSSVVVIDRGLHWVLFNNGLPDAGIEHAGVLPFPSSIGYWLGYLPALVRPDARDVLVVGLGGGSAVESIPATVKTIDVIELEPVVLAANRAIAADRARDPLSDPRVRVRIGDARGSLRLTAKQYDAIVSQPSHPWTAGASHLYTKEFFELAHSRLRPGGVFVQWMGLRYVDEDLLRSLASALVAVFENVEVYLPSSAGLLFAASDQPLGGLANAARALRADSESYARFGVHRVEDVARAWQLDADGVRALAEGAVPITDDDNLLAVRSARLRNGALELTSARRLFEQRDPLRGLAGDIDRGLLMRWLARDGQARRARELAKSDEEAVVERDLGWVDLADNAWRTRRATSRARDRSHPTTAMHC
jgi:spermidine synthase